MTIYLEYINQKMFLNSRKTLYVKHNIKYLSFIVFHKKETTFNICMKIFITV